MTQEPSLPSSISVEDSEDDKPLLAPSRSSRSGSQTPQVNVGSPEVTVEDVVGVSTGRGDVVSDADPSVSRSSPEIVSEKVEEGEGVVEEGLESGEISEGSSQASYKLPAPLSKRRRLIRLTNLGCSMKVSGVKDAFPEKASSTGRKSPRNSPVLSLTSAEGDRLREGLVLRKDLLPMSKSSHVRSSEIWDELTPADKAFLEEEDEQRGLNRSSPWIIASRSRLNNGGISVQRGWADPGYLETFIEGRWGYDVSSSLCSVMSGDIYTEVPRKWYSHFVVRSNHGSDGIRCGGCAQLRQDYSLKVVSCVKAWEEKRDRQVAGMCVNATLPKTPDRRGWSHLFTEVPYNWHSCALGLSLHPEPSEYGISRARFERRGLVSHSVALRVMIGVNLPWVDPGRRYTCFVPIWARLPLRGLPEYYWGSLVVVLGLIRIYWDLDEKERCRCSPMSGGLCIHSLDRRCDYLKYEPIDIRLRPHFGERVDVSVSSVTLQWLSTFVQPSEQASHPLWVPHLSISVPGQMKVSLPL